MVAQRWKKAIFSRPFTVAAEIRVYVVVIILADILIHRPCFPIWIVVVPYCDDIINIPTMHHIGDIIFPSCCIAKIANDCNLQIIVTIGRIAFTRFIHLVNIATRTVFPPSISNDQDYKYKDDR